MLKIIILIKKKKGMSREAFIDYSAGRLRTGPGVRRVRIDFRDGAGWNESRSPVPSS